LFRWCLTRCGYDRETAEDLMQQTYEELISGRARFAGDSSLKTFLFGVAQNLAFTHFRKATARARLAERAAILSEAHECRTLETEHFDSQRLWQAVRELSDRQRDVIELVFCNELTIEEAASVMQTTVGTARQHYGRAKRALAIRLADHEVYLNSSQPHYGSGDE
jgi:RNA polymerase sigma-70 factor (ECF subfamily)